MLCSLKRRLIASDTGALRCDHAVNNAVGREFLDSEVDQLVTSVAQRSQLDRFDCAGSDIQTHKWLAAFQEIERHQDRKTGFESTIRMPLL